VVHPPLDDLEEEVPIKAVEEFCHIRVHDPGDANLPALLAYLMKCLVLAVAFPKSMGEAFEVLLIDCPQDHGHCPLSDLVLEPGHPNRPLSSVVLVQPHPLGRRRLVASGTQPLVEVPEVLVEVLAVLLCGHSVHTRCCIF